MILCLVKHILCDSNRTTYITEFEMSTGMVRVDDGVLPEGVVVHDQGGHGALAVLLVPVHNLPLELSVLRVRFKLPISNVSNSRSMVKMMHGGNIQIVQDDV